MQKTSVVDLERKTSVSLCGNTYPIIVPVPNEFSDFSDLDLIAIRLLTAELRLDITPTSIGGPL